MRLFSAVALAIASVSAFEYHDNAVDIATDLGSLGFTFNGSYTLTDFDITGGQDPEHHIATGQVRSFSGGGSMIFRVGRHGSGDVAHWWSERIAPGQNTFGHNPDDLNFAFLGTLALTLTGGILPDPTCFTIPNAGFAQGHTGNNNNWWFGGQTCVRGTGETVLCAATRDDTGEIWHFTFLRGKGDGENVVTLNFAQSG
ncbi:hypothetical protein AURDEDRAFT_124391 [Auricularia subglabra TFB-10046 SS5]|nr:hypothetical protein AURDEDRAFT_124391 [Auricularia subglabra TFB-10046 SS5]